MTRKHFGAIAAAFRDAAEAILIDTPAESDARYWRQRQWDEDVILMADLCEYMSLAFDRDVFLVRAGYTHRPDGSMFPDAVTAVPA